MLTFFKTQPSRSCWAISKMCARLLTIVVLIINLHEGQTQPQEESLIDLGYTFNDKSNQYPIFPIGFHLKYYMKGQTPGGYWLQAEEIRQSVHCGTHMDAPVHFAYGKWAMEEIPVENLIAPGSVIDVSKHRGNNPDYQLTKQDIVDWEAEHGSIGNTILLINFGWAKHYFNRTYYYAGPGGSLGPHGNDTSDLHFPGIHPEAAQYIADKTPKVYGVGVDSASLDYGQSTHHMAHRTILAKNIFGIENVANLDTLPPRVDEVIALPTSVEGSGGAPVRVLARLRKSATSGFSHMSMSILLVTVLELCLLYLY